MTPAQILRAMEAQREFMVDLGQGRKVSLRRPTELQIQTNFVKLQPGDKPEDPPKPILHVDPAQLHRYATGWTGFAESDLIGAAGSSDPAPFDTVLLQAWLEEHTEHLPTLVQGLLDSIVQHLNARSDAAKN